MDITVDRKTCARCGRTAGARLIVAKLPCGDEVCAECLNKSIEDGLRAERVNRIRKLLCRQKS